MSLVRLNLNDVISVNSRVIVFTFDGLFARGAMGPLWEEVDVPEAVAARIRRQQLDDEAQRWIALTLLARGTIDDLS